MGFTGVINTLSIPEASPLANGDRLTGHSEAKSRLVY
jgi:hypothetical protein